MEGGNKSECVGPCALYRAVIGNPIANLMLGGGGGDEPEGAPLGLWNYAPCFFSPPAEPLLRRQFSEAFACCKTFSKGCCGLFAKACRA